MISKQYKQVLLTIAKELNDNVIRWAIGGSCLLHFHGIQVEPNDIDILVQSDDLLLLERILSNHQHTESKPKGIYLTKQFFTIIIDDISIDIMIDFTIQTENDVYHFPFHVEHMIQLDNVILPLSSLSEWHTAYNLMGRTKQPELIASHTSFRIDTERLFLTHLQYSDFEEVLAYASDKEHMYYERNPFSRETLFPFFTELITHQLMYSIKLKPDGQHIGHIYFGPFGPRDFNEFSIGYILDKAYQNMGYCSEASKALVHYGFTKLGIHRVSARCNPDNIGSWKVMEKIGLKKEGHLKQRVCFKHDEEGNPIWWDELVYGITEEDWKNIDKNQ